MVHVERVLLGHIAVVIEHAVRQSNHFVIPTRHQGQGRLRLRSAVGKGPAGVMG